MKHRFKKHKLTTKTVKQASAPITQVSVRRVGFYLQDANTPAGKRRKVVALHQPFIDALEWLVGDYGSFSGWLTSAAAVYCQQGLKETSPVRIAEHCIIQALLKQVACVKPSL